MEALKQKLFDVLAKAITIEEFENWLYNNEGIASSINENDMLFDIISLNYRDRHIYSELEKYCHKYYDPEEYLVSLVESSCRKLVQMKTSEDVWPVIMHIGSFMDYDKDYWLLNQFYYMDDELSLSKQGYYKEKNVIADINKMAMEVLKELENLSMPAKIERLKKGIDMSQNKENVKIDLNTNFKKWYQFWK